MVVVNLFEKSFQVRQFHLRLDREIKHALAHRPIDRRARNFNVVFVAPPVQLDFMRQLHAIHGAVVVVQDFFLHAADGRRLLCDQVRLRIKKYLPLHAGSCGYFELQRVLPAHLRVSHKGQCDFAFLEVEQPRVVILRRRFQLHSFRTHQRPKHSGRTLMPRRLPVVRFDQVLFAHQQFRVVAVRQLGIQRVRPALAVIRREGSFERQRLNPGQRLAAPCRLHVLVDDLPRFLGVHGENLSSQNRCDEDGKKARAHGDHLYERRSTQKVSFEFELRGATLSSAWAKERWSPTLAKRGSTTAPWAVSSTFRRGEDAGCPWK